MPRLDQSTIYRARRALRSARSLRHRTLRADRRLRSAARCQHCRSRAAAERVTAKKSSVFHRLCSMIRERLGAWDCSPAPLSPMRGEYTLCPVRAALPSALDAEPLPLARMREQAASERSVALPISLSENASRFGAISRLNHASSRWAGCSRAQVRLRRCPSLIASPHARGLRRRRPEDHCLRQSALRAPYARPRSHGGHARAVLSACTLRNDGACVSAQVHRIRRTRSDGLGVLRRSACAMLALRTAAAARLCEALRAAAIGPDPVRCGTCSRI